MGVVRLDCPVKDCPRWMSANTADPYAGYCRDELIISCFNRSRAIGFPDIKIIEEEDKEDNG